MAGKAKEVKKEVKKDVPNDIPNAKEEELIPVTMEDAAEIDTLIEELLDQEAMQEMLDMLEAYEPSELEAAENMVQEVEQAQADYDAQLVIEDNKEREANRLRAKAIRRASDALDMNRLEAFNKMVLLARDMHTRLKSYGWCDDCEAWMDVIEDNLK